MQRLELKVPPPVVAAALAAAMWIVARSSGATLDVPAVVRTAAAAAIATAAAGITLAGIVAFRRAKTTVNPLKPASASSLVTAGIYRVTRNPMYLGLLLLLCAWAVFLASAWALAGPVGFVLYIDRFQIVPEERVLEAMFGAAYSDYKGRVRRWL